MRSYGRKEEQHLRRKKTIPFPSVKDALHALHTARLAEKRPLGKILGDAVTSSVQTLLMVGGFIILFSVFNRLLSVVQLTDVLSVFTKGALTLFQLPTQLDIPLLSGMFEITLGSKLVSETDVSLLQKPLSSALFLGLAAFPYKLRWQVFYRKPTLDLNHSLSHVCCRAFMPLSSSCFYGNLFTQHGMIRISMYLNLLTAVTCQLPL